MGIWDDYARRVQLALGPALERTDRWGRYIPDAEEEGEVALPPDVQEFLMRPAPGAGRWAEDFGRDLLLETPAEAYRRDMQRRLRDVDRLRGKARMFQLPYDPATPPAHVTLPYDPSKGGPWLAPAVEQPADLYRKYPQMPRTPIRRGDKAQLNDEAWATSAFNELAPYTGAGFDDAARTVLGSIKNGDEASGTNRPVTAAVSIGRRLSPKEKDRLEYIRYHLLPEVRAERETGFDRALGTPYFNFRSVGKFNNDRRRLESARNANINRYPSFTIGPFDNSFPNKDHDAKGVYAVFY